MKLFSRTSLVAFGTAAALGVTSLTAPAFAEENPADVTDNVVAATPADIVEEVEDVVEDVVTEELKLTQPALITGNVGTKIATTTVETSSGVAESFTASNLPTGVFINNDGEIFGTPSKTFSGAATVTATDPAGKTAKIAVNFNIDEGQSNGSSDMDNINDWIKIITAVIGALTTVLTFTSRLDSFMK